jgi:L-threonylcarbamoyladenylate synthase
MGGPTRLDLRADPDADLTPAVEHLRAGGLVAYPTETVYGVGGACTDAAVRRLRRLKDPHRPGPFLALVESAASVDRLEWTEAARELARIFWPGSLTLVLRDPLGIFPEGVRDPRAGTVGIRVSSHPVAARLVAELGAPITSTSVNVPGEPPAASGREAAETLRAMGAPDVLVLDAGTLPPSPPSSVVDCTGPEPSMLREGTVPIDRLRCVLPEIHGRPHA